jgi:hypothetical protein
MDHKNPIMELKPPIRVSFDQLYLDPNNPRLGSMDKPGYGDPAQFMDEKVQVQLEIRMRRTYKALKELVSSIMNLGWVPVDAILVWESPQAEGHYVVVEGNARTTALRMIRREHSKELKRLAKARTNELMGPSFVQELEERVAHYERIVASTRVIEVFPVAAPNAASLARTLPRLLGVRHISHAQQWKPYATNLYIYSLYRQNFEDSRPGERFRLEEELLKETGALVSVNSWRVRRAVQGVVAFGRFRAAFEDRLPQGERFADQDQNFFLYLFEPGYARDQFGLRDEDLHLEREMEEVLFRWAFSKERGLEDGMENRNVFRSPEDIRLWNKIARYDERVNTHFSRRLDISRPDHARPIGEMEADYVTHRANRTPLETMQSLVQTLKSMEVETLLAQKDEIKPAITELMTLGSEYLAMIQAIEAPTPPKRRRKRGLTKS